MPSDTVWVALVGLGTTVGALTVQGLLARGAEERRNAREDRHRREDHDWSVLQQNIEERRAVYGDLLQTAADLRRNVELIVQREFTDPSTGMDLTEMAFERNAELTNRFRRLVARATLVVVDESVLDIANRFLQNAGAVRDVSRRQSVSDSPQIKGEVASLGTLTRQLRDACRRDLGYDLDEPRASDN
jgi:hypothetical protein